MIQNKELELAIQFIEKTDRNLFVTGKAGTGKTTFLHKIKKESLKRLVIVAPTGVAAINAKGVTIHSFFQMPFGPILPTNNGKSLSAHFRFSKRKIDIIKSLDLIIIDEISMVRADLLDGIDQVLRRYKNRNKVFGGVQMLMIGDLQQLSPVVNHNEWELLKPFYRTVYFFSSKAFQEANAISIEFKHIYRQDNQEFINILNEIRDDSLSKKSAEILNKRYHPHFSPKKNEGYITLTTHNNRADAINKKELEKIDQKSHFFNAVIKGKFSENAYPNSKKLELKVGAQVLFIKNDSSPEKRYFNGKIGVVIAIEDTIVRVKCPNDDFVIDTVKETWENVSYTIDEQTKKIKEQLIGSFAQLPLRLAWAITIHKSQGLTFEKAIIDTEASFAHGQTYVALSRCTSLEGIVLKTLIKDSSIINDEKVLSFNKNIERNTPNKQMLDESEKTYQLNLISELFDYHSFLYPTTRMIDIFYKNRSSLNGTIIEPLQTIKDSGIVPLLKIATDFKTQLQQLSKENILAEKSAVIQDRFKKAIGYFSNQTENCIKNPLKKISFSTDSKAIKKELEKQMETLQGLVSVKLFSLHQLKEGFEAKKYLSVRADALLQHLDKKPKKKKSTFSKESALTLKLRELREILAMAENIPLFQVFTQKTLYEISKELPKNPQELLRINGMGKIRVKKYGEEILAVVDKYNAEEDKHQRKKKPKKKEKSSKEISLELFKGGISVEEIAKERDLVVGTIKGHLTSFILTGEVDVLELISKEKYKKIRKSIENTPFETISELKEKLNNSYTYPDLKMVLVSMEN